MLPGEAINARHHQHVTLAEKVEHCSQLLPPRSARAAALLSADDLAPGCFQRCFLNGKVLIGGAYASVSDDGHYPGPLSRLVVDDETVPSRNSKVNPIETRFVSHDADSIG